MKTMKQKGKKEKGRQVIHQNKGSWRAREGGERVCDGVRGYETCRNEASHEGALTRSWERLGFTDRGSAPDKVSERLTEMMASADGRLLNRNNFKAEFCTKNPAASYLSRL